MASIYPELRKELDKEGEIKTNKRGECTIRIVVIVDRKATRIPSGYHVAPKYWDDVKQRIKPGHPNSLEYNTAIETKITALRRQYALMDAQGKRMSAKKLSNAEKVGDTYKAVAGYFSRQFRAEGKIGTADRYDSVAAQIERYFPKIKASAMDSDWASEYRAKLKGQAHNTIVGKLRNISAVLTKAVEAGFIPANNLSGAKIGSFHPAQKASLSFEELEQLWQYGPDSRGAAVAKNAFFFSYYTTGARFKDVLLMPKSALYTDGAQLRIKWMPAKTKNAVVPKWIDVEVCPRLREIIEFFRNDSGTILGVVDPRLSAEELEKAIDVAESRISQDLKTVIAKAGIGKYITFHCARVTLIRHLDEISNRQLLTIKDAVGHSQTKITEGYLGVNRRRVDELTRALYGA